MGAVRRTPGLDSESFNMALDSWATGVDLNKLADSRIVDDPLLVTTPSIAARSPATPASVPSSGLEDPKNISKHNSLALRLADINGAENRINGIQAMADQLVRMAGMPPGIGFRENDQNQIGIAQFSDGRCAILFNSGAMDLLHKPVLTNKDIQELAVAVMHEVRHAEQTWNMVRAGLIGKHDPDVSSIIREHAIARPLALDTPLGQQTKAIFESLHGSGLSYRDGVLKKLRNTPQKSAEYPDVYRAYRDLPEERDALRVGEMVRKAWPR
jgi:hypothetical protein